MTSDCIISKGPGADKERTSLHLFGFREKKTHSDFKLTLTEICHLNQLYSAYFKFGIAAVDAMLC